MSTFVVVITLVSVFIFNNNDRPPISDFLQFFTSKIFPNLQFGILYFDEIDINQPGRQLTMNSLYHLAGAFSTSMCNA